MHLLSTASISVNVGTDVRCALSARVLQRHEEAKAAIEKGLVVVGELAPGERVEITRQGDLELYSNVSASFGCSHVLMWDGMPWVDFTNLASIHLDDTH